MEVIDIGAGSLRNSSTSTKVSADHDATLWMAVPILFCGKTLSHDLLQSWHCLKHQSGGMRCQFYRRLRKTYTHGSHIQLLSLFIGGVAPTSLVTNGTCSVTLLLLCIIPHLLGWI